MDLATGGRDLEARLLDLEQRPHGARDLGWSIVLLPIRVPHNKRLLLSR